MNKTIKVLVGNEEVGTLQRFEERERGRFQQILPLVEKLPISFQGTTTHTIGVSEVRVYDAMHDIERDFAPQRQCFPPSHSTFSRRPWRDRD